MAANYKPAAFGSGGTGGSSSGSSLVSGSCTGLPSNAAYYSGATTYTLSGAANGTSLTASYNASPTANTCQFNCNTSYSWTGSACVTTLANTNGEIAYASCTAAGQTYNYTTTYTDPVAGACNAPDKVLCTRSGYGQVWAMCNAGSATTSGYGGYYQWGNNGNV